MTLPPNPIPMRGLIERCWLFVYRTPSESVADLLPAGLELVTRNGWAFWNVVVCELSGMRPCGIPDSLGLGYRHVAYRLVVRAKAGRNCEGLYFVRSDCDRALVATVGNWLTPFGFHRGSIRLEETPETVRGTVEAADASAAFRIDRLIPPRLSEASPFASLAEAAKELKYAPRAFATDREGVLHLLAVTRDETRWRDRVVTVLEAHWQFFQAQEAFLELCYEVQPIEYRWERGRKLSEEVACVS